MIAPGTRLGPYEITSKLGEGGMGVVYRAHDTTLRRDVAIKVLPEAFTEDRDRLARFEREAQLLAQLNHPNIAQIYGVESSGGAHALVIELVDGPSLADRLQSGCLPVAEALLVARQIAEALEEAHDNGIIHRDLKPQNIKVSRQGKVKLLDFGLAKAMEPPVAAGVPSPSVIAASPTLTVGVTTLGVILGTAAYMSPEQAKGLAVDKRADIWAFGVVLYEMLTGTTAFRGETVTEVLAAVVRDDPDASKLPPQTPPSIRRLIGRCLEKHPRRRLRDIGEARIAIEETLAGPAPVGTDPRATFSGPREEPRPVESPLRRALPWVITSLLALALVAVGAWAWRSGGGRDLPARFDFAQKSYRRESIFVARFASDGRTIVYSAAGQDALPRLFVIRPEYPEPQPLGFEQTQLLAVSSRDELAVLSHARWVGHRMFEGTLGRVALGGGEPRGLVDRVREADWSPDGSELAIIREVAGKDRLEYPIGNVLHESSGYVSDLRVSPDGERVAFFEHPVRYDDRGSVAVVDRRGSRTVVASGYWGAEGLAWQPDGEALLFSATHQGGNYQMRTVDLAGHERADMPTPGTVTVHDVSRDGRRLFTRDDLTLHNLVRPPGEKEARDFSWQYYSIDPVLSADGRFLALTDEGPTGGLNYTTLLRRTDGSSWVRLGEGSVQALSPDGRWAAVYLPTSPATFMLYPTGTGESRRLDHGEFEAISDADWLADGTKLLVSANEPGKAARCYLLSLDGGSPRAVTPEGTTDGRLSPDGLRVAARSVEGGYRIYPTDGGQARDLPGLTADDKLIRWSPDGRALWVYVRRSLPVRIGSIAIETGQRTPLETIELRDPTGVVSVRNVSLADDPSVYAACAVRYTSLLFVAEPTP